MRIHIPCSWLMKFVPGLAGLAGLCAGMVSAAEVGWTETWSGTNTEGWTCYDLINEKPQAALTLDNGSAKLKFNAQSRKMPPEEYMIKADADASGGRFVGDYLSNGVRAISFQLYCEYPVKVYTAIWNEQSGRLWRSHVSNVVSGEWQDVTVPVHPSFLRNVNGFNEQSAFEEDLKHVTWVGVVVRRNISLATQGYWLDNFTLTTNSAGVEVPVTDYYLTLSTEGQGSLDKTNGWNAAYSTNTVTATPALGWHLEGWTGDTNGCVTHELQIGVVMDRQRTVTAVFALDTHTLVVTSSWGRTVPSVGTHTYNSGADLSCSVTNSPVPDGSTTQYVCIGWAGSGSVTNGIGTHATFGLLTDSSLTWLWKTQYLAVASAGVHGSVTPIQATWVDQGSSTPSYTAAPDSGWLVSRWNVNGILAQMGGTGFVVNGLMGPTTVQVLFNAPPAWSNQADVSARIGQPINVNVSATDPDGTTPTLSAIAKPAAAAFTDLGNGTGTFTWMPAQATDVGPTTVRLVASDGQYAATNSFVVDSTSFAVTNPLPGALLRVGRPLSIAWVGAWPLQVVDVALWKGTDFVRLLTNSLVSPTSNMVWDVFLRGPLPSGTDYWVTVTDVDNVEDNAASGEFMVINGGLPWLPLLLEQ